MEEERYKLDPNFMSGQIEGLRAMLASVALELPDRAIRIVEASARSARENAQRMADEMDNDARRNFASGVYDVTGPFADCVEEWIDERKDGARLPTIMPFPVDPSDEWPQED